MNFEDMKASFEEALQNENNGNNGGEREEVPHGQYIVKVEKLYYQESRTGKHMARTWFRILEGKYKNMVIFYNQLIDTPVKLQIFARFLKSLDSGVELTFDSMDDFKNLLKTVCDEITDTLEYDLDFNQNAKGYDTYTIKGVYDAQ